MHAKHQCEIRGDEAHAVNRTGEQVVFAALLQQGAVLVLNSPAHGFEKCSAAAAAPAAMAAAAAAATTRAVEAAAEAEALEAAPRLRAGLTQ